MPELPEVETIRLGLKPHLVGQIIREVQVRETRLRWPVEANMLAEQLPGRKVQDIDRRGKYLLFRLSDGLTLIIHLGMSGKLLFLTKTTPLDKHDHVVFYFEAGTELRFRDPRRFGMIDTVLTAQWHEHPRLRELGVEPLDSAVRAKALFQQAQLLQKPVKNLLMDGHFMVGVGNIYANEALFRARIHPATPARQLTLRHWQRLLRAIREVLHAAIASGGTTLNDFVNSRGDAGYFQLSLAVYGREGEPCPGCGHRIEKTVLAGRSTFFCPRCQRG